MEGPLDHIWFMMKFQRSFLWIAFAGAIALFAFAPRSDSETTGNLSAAPSSIYKLLQEHRVDEAISLGESARRVAERQLVPSDPLRIGIIGALADARLAHRDTADAFNLLDAAVRQLDTGQGISVGLAMLYQKLADICGFLGRDQLAEAAASRALQIYQMLLPPNDPVVGAAMTTLAIQERALGKTVEEFPLLKHALAILSTSESPDTALALKTTLLQLASFYEISGEPDKAAAYRVKAGAVSTPQIYANALPDNFAAVDQKGEDALKRGDFAEAAREFEINRQAAAGRLGPESQMAMFETAKLARAYVRQGDRVRAKPLMDSLVHSVYENYERNFDVMTEQERLQFAATADQTIELYCAFVDLYHDLDADLADRMYDLALWSKGSVSTVTQIAEQRLRSVADPVLRQLSHDLSERRQTYREESALGPTSKGIRIKAEMDELDRRIAIRLGGASSAAVSWRDIKARLRPAEAAVEVIRFTYPDGLATINNSYYGALIIKPEWVHAKYVRLGNTEEIENGQASRYRAYVHSKLPTTTAPFDFWERLDKSFEVRPSLIYLSPDGVLNNFSFAVIPDSTGKSLIDLYDIRTVLSTRVIVDSSSEVRSEKTITLVGNPNFELPSNGKHISATEETRLPVNPSGQSSNAGTSGRSNIALWEALPQSGIEVSAIAMVFQKRGWRVKQLTEDRAAKSDVLAAMTGSRVLHFATHGFFNAERGQVGPAIVVVRTEAAMLNSGVVLAGANTDLRQNSRSARSILTAYEISSSNLDGTELVVMTACDTGIGDTLNGGEVFGLRRAFQIAGAKAVLMSMWKVGESSATTEMITDFYESWLSGVDKFVALRNAQLKARRANAAASYWGELVLIEE
jgi:CHAT domain-containing protein/tetratricopeptide (TPR) repeat protein